MLNRPLLKEVKSDSLTASETPADLTPTHPLSRRKFLNSAMAAAILQSSPLLRSTATAQALPSPGEAVERLVVHLSIGHRSSKLAPFHLALEGSHGLKFERKVLWEGTAGNGHVESQSFTIEYPALDVQPIQDLQTIWAYLIAHSDADTARRLTQDPAWRIDPRQLTFRITRENASGFTLTIDQLLNHPSLWIPALDMYVAVGDSPRSFDEHEQELRQYKGARILDQVHRAPEASYDQYKDLWEDMGNPAFVHPAQQGPGHIVCLSWDSTIAKFGVDRGAGVWSDYGNPDQFRFWFRFSDLADGIVPYWKSQSLTDGLPIITTVLERDGVRYEVEQFSYPLGGPSKSRAGDLEMLLLQNVKVTNLTGEAHTLDVCMVHERHLPTDTDSDVVGEPQADHLFLGDAAHHDVMLAIHAPGAKIAWAGANDTEHKMKRVDITLPLSLSAHGTQEFFVTLPSHPTTRDRREALQSLDYHAARTQTIQFWSDYVARGAQFRVPEPVVNDLFRTNLWHALRLPRKHADGRMDLPYSNFAYQQTGTPWPVNQAVYVDYMLYGLRGYDSIASEEILAVYGDNQEFSGHINGNANWLAYTPGMLYAVAQNYLLSGDRGSLEKALPDTLRALDWSLDQIRAASDASGVTQHVVSGPLNDITGPGYWAFNQAYLYAGLDLLGKALDRAGHPRAAECRSTAEAFRQQVNRAFRDACISSPLVQLRDRTWIPFVPSQAGKPGRNFGQWYPTDVDTGALHLVRLKVIPPEDEMADFLLNDDEDNLFLHGWGIANEPVYNQQATAYLLRDDIKATVRAFYSYMACAFSHSVFESVEHRWCWGQYFGPPSTDGAWFELYRNMLIRELDDDSLLLAQATPLAWLEDGKRIEVKDAPTWFGNLSFDIHSQIHTGTIHASFHLERRHAAKAVFVRLRHPEGKRLHRVTVNSKSWTDFDPAKEWVRIGNVEPQAYTIVASYSAVAGDLTDPKVSRSES